MRIHLTSVAESKKAEEIQKIVKSMFPDCSVVVIPNKYATEKGREEVRAYSKQYYQKNAEKQRQQRRERYYKQKAEKEQQKLNEQAEIEKKQKEEQDVEQNYEQEEDMEM